jgi:hypothetical protein
MSSLCTVHRFWKATSAGAAACVALALGMGCLPTAQAAGSVELVFTQPERYTDAGIDAVERQRNLALLTLHVQGWSAQLPDGHRLRLVVEDVDLAGEQRLNLWHPELRILRGTVDWPRMTLRWSLTTGERELQGGEARLSDKGYLMFSARMRQGEPLSHERRMLDDWLQREVLPALAR